jgi:hypothetical protein
VENKVKVVGKIIGLIILIKHEDIFAKVLP